MKETDIQKEILRWLSERGIFAFRLANIPYGKLRTRSEKFNPSGLPDILCFHGRKTIGFEVKSENGKIRDEQKLIKEKFYDNGAEYHFVRSLADVETIILSK